MRRISETDPLLNFFASYEVQPNGCWLWMEKVRPDGYGRILVQGKRQIAHRFSYATFVGEIPTGLTVDHVCHNSDDSCPGGPCLHRRCVNFTHLEAVEQVVNVMRGKSMPAFYGRQDACARGHLYTPENTHTNELGHRTCRECNRAKSQALRDSRRTIPNLGPFGLRAHCKKGHPYDKANTYVNARGHRYCRACARIKEQRRRDAIKAARNGL
jgi:hypothetical protein